MQNSGQNRWFFAPCDLKIWQMTLKNNRAPLLCYFKLCTWFHCHLRVQTGVTFRKRLSWLLTSVTLTFDLWPWPFALTSLLSLETTTENFMMKRWREYSQKGVMGRRTDGHTDGLNHSYSCLVATKNQVTAQFGSKLVIFLLSRVTLKFDGWPWKAIGHLFYVTLALCIISKPSVNSNLHCVLHLM